MSLACIKYELQLELFEINLFCIKEELDLRLIYPALFINKFFSKIELLPDVIKLLQLELKFLIIEFDNVSFLLSNENKPPLVKFSKVSPLNVI